MDPLGAQTTFLFRSELSSRNGSFISFNGPKHVRHLGKVHRQVISPGM